MLVVGDRDGGDVAGHFWRDRELPRGDEGIVGCLEMPGVVPIEVAEPARHAKKREAEQGSKRMPAQNSLGGSIGVFTALLVFLQMLTVALRRQFYDAALDRTRSGSDRIFLTVHAPRAS